MGESLEQVREFKLRCQEVFEGLGYDLTPRYPYVLIRVIPKQRELQTGRRGIVLHTPDKQNKPNWEGQVLKVWKPRLQYSRSARCEQCFKTGRTTFVDKFLDKPVLIESELKVGDHVIFPHFIGIPVPELCYYYKFGEYQLIEDKGMPAVVEYTKEPVEDRLRNYLSKFISDRYKLERATRGLMQESTVIFNEEARTLSGA